jgi:outer membrane receptor protein involved in Fe transport
MKTLLNTFILLFCVASFAQTTVKGTVSDDSGMPLAGANIIIDGTTTGVVADFDGNFALSTSMNPPFTIQVSSVGFETLSQKITKNNETLSISLKEGNPLDEVVISASRTPERIFESPVTVERFGIREIKNTASVDFYGGLENIKGVDINVNSLTFQSVNTRGFATTSNTRFLQLVDGMDNSTPALNFPIGNLVGMIEADVQSVELLPGASSALYGAGAMNGILVMTSKNPFDSDGISVSLKRGITSQEAAGDNAYTDFSIRMAHKFSNKFAAKANFGWLKGHDWVANNLTSKTAGATRAATNYDGINVYGDERAANIAGVGQQLVQFGIISSAQAAALPSVDVTRTGYNEQDLTDYNAESVKADWGLYFRPFEDDFEISYVGKVGTGTTLFQGVNRYNIKNFLQEQHKIEVKNDNFFARLYKVSDDAGDSYDMYTTGLLINEAWKPSAPNPAAGVLGWYAEYALGYLGALAAVGGDADAAHGIARGVADTGRLEPGSQPFQETLNAISDDPTFLVGSKFIDRSNYTHFDGNYNFGHLTDAAEIQVGVSRRWWELNSEGNIYTDYNAPITYEDFGVYAQVQKDFLDDRLNVTASARYDDSSVFDGFVSPRVSVGYTAGSDKNHNIRASFQTGFRNPTTQDLYIGLDAGSAVLVGGAPGNGDRYQGEIVGASADDAFTNSYTLNSFQTFLGTAMASGVVDPSLLEVANPDYIKPEQIRTLELGYRGKLDNLTVDLSVYSNKITDFMSTQTVVSPGAGLVDGSDGGIAVGALLGGGFQVYSAYTNSEAEVKSYGGAVGLSTKVFGGFNLNTNYTYAKLDFDSDAYPDFNTNFNTPEHKVKVGFGKAELFENFGFNMAWRWSDNYEWEASFGNGEIPAYHTMDAQINYTIPSLKSTLKVGATNLLGDEYFTMFGSGYIGSMYYLTLNINY